MMKRQESGRPLFPSMTVIDSQSVRTGLPHAESGIDGGKRVKGIKRHIAVDRNGYPLGADITTANVHESKGAERMMARVLSDYKQITLIKADMGYRSAFKGMPLDEMGITLECVKSNSLLSSPALGLIHPACHLLQGKALECEHCWKVTFVRLRPVIFASFIGHLAR